MVKKVGEVIPMPQRCKDPEHDFPNMIVLPPGRWEHTCPTCKLKQTVYVGQPMWSKTFSVPDSVHTTWGD